MVEDHQVTELIDNMEFSIIKYGNLEGKKSALVQDLSYKIHDYLNAKSYGKSIRKFLIGLICVKPEFEQFFPVKKPRYTEDKVETHDGHSVHIIQSFSMGIKLDYNEVLKISDDIFKQYLLDSVVDSVQKLEKMPKKVTDFDLSRFKEDLIQFQLEYSSPDGPSVSD